MSRLDIESLKPDGPQIADICGQLQRRIAKLLAIFDVVENVPIRQDEQAFAIRNLDVIEQNVEQLAQLKHVVYGYIHFARITQKSIMGECLWVRSDTASLTAVNTAPEGDIGWFPVAKGARAYFNRDTKRWTRKYLENLYSVEYATLAQMAARMD